MFITAEQKAGTTKQSRAASRRPRHGRSLSASGTGNNKKSPGAIRKRVRKPYVIAITGGSGSGKSWLASLLIRILGERAVRLSLDSFYRDRSHLSLARRARLNFDNPRAIDWLRFERTLRNLASGRPADIPDYDFATHSRTRGSTLAPRDVIVADGLWLLRRRAVRSLIDLPIYMECPRLLRLERRLERDIRARGRTASSVRLQFRTTVEPMHGKYVEPQKRWAAMIVKPGQSAALARKIVRRLEKTWTGS